MTSSVCLAVAEMGVVLGAVDGEEEAIEVVAVAVGERPVEGPPAEVPADHATRAKEARS